jgi:pyruvate/2-oxoglutarate dehydrogenase complex dihydrolipoamide dehydrogenase (E3) component
MTRAFDAIIIGAGQAGPSLAGRLTAAGQTVALIERKLVGGTCVNTGCTPTKALVASAYAAHLAGRAADFGVDVSGGVAVDSKALKARQRRIADEARENIERWLRSMSGLTLIEGHARFIAPGAIDVSGETLKANRIFINVGGRAAVPDLPGIRDVPYLTNSSILQLDHIPPHLVVIGGSYIGLEFAQIYRRFGSEVTIVERGSRLIGREDPEISDAIADIFRAEGIALRLGAECIRLARTQNSVTVGLNCRDGSPEVVGSHVLLAVGRVPNTHDLGLDKAQVMTDKRGFIQVSDDLQTNMPGVYALGDCNGRGAFTHTSYNDFEIAAANLLDGEARKISDRIPGYALYIDPPLGRVGLTETQARVSGRPILIGTRPMTRVARAVEKGETAGLMKIVADAETKQILGAAILGTGGDEAIHSILDAMNAGMTYTRLKWAVPIHPTVSELIPTVVGELHATKPGVQSSDVV